MEACVDAQLQVHAFPPCLKPQSSSRILGKGPDVKDLPVRMRTPCQKHPVISQLLQKRGHVCQITFAEGQHLVTLRFTWRLTHRCNSDRQSLQQATELVGNGAQELQA